jgi:signal transduction histidine kinase
VQIGERRTRDGGLVSIRTDITALKQNEFALMEARDQAEAANRSKSDFLASVSHELRTPLHAILGLAEVVRDQKADRDYEALVKKYATIIHESGQHLLDLISDILDMSKIEAGRFVLAEEPVDLSGVVAACVSIVRGRADKSGVRLENRLGAAVPLIKGDRRAVKQVVLNLLSNAVKFTERGGRVRVEAARDSEQGLSIAVSDTGIGIAAVDLPKVTEPFWQADQGAARKYEGTGLGLAICKRFMELHGGGIEFESAKGKGTTVTIRFPAARVLSL